MIYISHRGNIDGKDEISENTLYSINKCLDMDLNVEVDVWHIDNHLYLGHDEPTTKISIQFLQNERIWCHAKNAAALIYLSEYDDVHYFWHENDMYTITSKNIIWAYPGQPTNNKSICVKPELHTYSKYDLSNALGICSDNILYYKQHIDG